MHAYCINNFQQCKMHSYEESPMCPNSFFIRVSLITYTHTQFFNKKGLYVQFCSLSFYFINVIFSGTKGFILVNLSPFFKDHAFGFTSNNSLPKYGHE